MHSYDYHLFDIKLYRVRIASRERSEILSGLLHNANFLYPIFQPDESSYVQFRPEFLTGNGAVAQQAPPVLAVEDEAGANIINVPAASRIGGECSGPKTWKHWHLLCAVCGTGNESKFYPRKANP